jgi:hypothetical protein
VKNSAQSAWFGGAWGIISGEVSYGCAENFMGSSGAPVYYGNTNYPIKAQNAVGGAWRIRNWTSFGNNACGGRYKNSVTDSKILTWDSRN